MSKDFLICPFCNANEKTKFEFLGCADNPDAQPKSYAFNVYLCECGAICKESVWNTPGKLWINVFSTETKRLEDTKGKGVKNET